MRLLAALSAAAVIAALASDEARARGSNIHTFDQNTTVWDGNGGPWLTGHVYVLNAYVSVPNGQTLTIQPGAIVKIGPQLELKVEGTLSAVGTSGSPIRFTSTKDDTLGGDTNGDGSATTPAKGDMRGLWFSYYSSGSSMKWCRVRYGGWYQLPAVTVSTNGFSMADCVVEDCDGAGIQLAAHTGPVERNAFDRCRRPAEGIAPRWLHVFRDNTASNNVEGEVLRVVKGGLGDDAVVSDATWGPANSLNGTGVIEMTRPVSVSYGKTLTLAAGTTLLFDGKDSGISASNGDALVAAGTSSDPIVLTSIGDPDFGGAGAAPEDWSGLYIATSPTSALMHTEVRYAGAYGHAALRVNASDIPITDCRFADSGGDGLAITGGQPTVSGCAFDSNTGYPITPVPLAQFAGFSNNTASGNGSGDVVAFGGGTLTSAATIDAAAAFNGTGTFVLASSLTVGGAGTLTLGPGVVFKADPASGPALSVFGALNCNGTAAEPVVFTSLLDDTFGGDLNGDGAATTPGPGDWQGVKLFYTSDASQLSHTRIRYAGKNGVRSLYLDSADVKLTDCTVEHGGGDALESKGDSKPTIAGCAFDHCAGAPVVGLRLEAVGGLSGNTATGNGGGNSIRFGDSTVGAALTLPKSAAMNDDGVFVFEGSVGVVSNGHLTIAPGVVAKFDGPVGVTVSFGSLTAVGTDVDPITFTSLADDSVAGDTALDGPTTGTPGDWEGLYLYNAPAASLAHAAVRYAGAGDVASVHLEAGSLTMDHVAVEDGQGMGFRQKSQSALPLVTSCAFDRCTVPVYGVSVAALQGWTGNTAQGNSAGEAVRFFNTGAGSSFTLSKTESLNGNGAFVSIGYWDLWTSHTVTIQEGVTIKVAHAQSIDVDGTLLTNGTAAEPVVFTSLKDDAYGGDSNGDGGASAPAPGDWVGLAFGPSSDASTLNHTLIRYAGLGGAPSVDLDQADITMCDVVIEDGAGPGIDANGNSAPTLKDVSIEDNGGLAIENVTWGILGKMSGATASGNQGGDYVLVTSPYIGGDLTIHRESYFGSCIVVSATPDTNTGSLTFGRGVIVKVDGAGVRMKVKDVLGTGLEKVVFTSFHDDDHAGDTNQAATPPAKGDWIGVLATGVVEHALVRYAGADPGPNQDPIAVAAPKCVGVRADFSAGDGIGTSNGAALVAFQNDGVGINGGTIRASTAYGNGSYGFGSGSIAHVYDSIGWMNGPNGTENFQHSAGYVLGPPGCDVMWSCGTTVGIAPGTGYEGNCGSSGWGNVYTDPKFVNAPAGDLRLKADSPCRNYYRTPCPQSFLLDQSLCNPWGIAGNGYPGPATASRDHLEHPRSVDDDQLGPAPKRADLGAYERPVWTLAPIGEPVLGQVVQLHCVGPAGLAFYLLGFPGTGGQPFPLDDPYLDPYGYLCFDPGLVLSLATLPVGTPLALPVLDQPILDGLEVSIQAAVQGASGALETTNVYRPRFHR